ncbi:response regulator [Marinilongibacter aquaticus]|uniref:hybrid sensor histidine kinase/response regulator transcription factor n=1 Tax=Marinilongibacter aquaticus TaxID=2975157 RepID=UPI0021BD1ED8|nr:hybrid sensor histidine kinase/response regulator transcription factor [Marinilongibacter aquaticus]UBM59964.1 response regulator [Marinilongibacter aquaticus]
MLSTCLFLSLLCQMLCAQGNKHFAFQNLTVENGLSQNSVIGVAQDSTGYLWLATQDGLNRYSGKDFVRYNKQFQDITRPTFSRLGKVYVDRQNRLWIATSSGKLELYRRESDDFETVSGLSDVSALYQTLNHDFYVGTFAEGLFQIRAETQDTIHVLQAKETALAVYDMLENRDSLWIACSGKVYVLAEGKKTTEVHVSGAQLPNFSALARTENEAIWLGTYGQGLFRKTSQSAEFVPFVHPKLPNDLNVEDIFVDSQNRMWIATYGNGLYLYDPKDHSVLNFTENKDNPFAIHYNDLLCLYEDNAGVLWIGSDGAGANYYDSYLLKFNVLTDNQLPKNTTVDVIRSIATDYSGRVWIGTSGKGLTRMNLNKENTAVTFTPANSDLASGRIMSLRFDGKDLWIGHQGFGLNIWEASGKMRYFPEIADYSIWRIVEESENRSWLCTERHGLILFDKKSGVVELFSSENSALTSNNIRTVIKGEKDILWIGTEENGLFRLDLSSKEISAIKEIPDKIKSLHYADGLLWIGTNGNGLKSLNVNNGELRVFSEKDGLPNNVVYGILPDGEGNLWLSSNMGIAKFDTETLNIVKYDNYDYLQSYEFNTGAYHKDEEGVLYFGGLKGLNWFNPKQLQINPIRPQTVLTGMQVFGRDVALQKDLELHYNENTVTFTFASLVFSQPDRNQYKYRLLANDTEWISSGNANTAHYTNLPPDRYEFQVLSSNYDGVWAEIPAKYTFTILKPWYATNLAKVLYVALFLTLSYLFVYYLKWRWSIQQKLKLEQEETSRLKKLDELKTKLYTDISHEIRTPLTLISGPIHNQLSRSNLSEKDKKDLDLVRKNSDRMMQLVNQMLDLSRLESGEVRLQVSKGNLNILLKQSVEAFVYLAAQKEIVLTSQIEGLENAWFDRDAVEKMLSNLISNAIKYAPQGSQVYIAATEKEGHLHFSIANEANAETLGNLNSLFKRFYQNNVLSEGLGVGLALVSELAKLSQGSIEAEGLEHNMLNFRLTLPITEEAFDPESIHQEIPDSDLNILPLDENQGQYTLLIVEDNLEIREFTASLFQDRYRIILAQNGKEGLEKVSEFMPDLIISDIMMPVKSGIDLCREVKEEPLTSHIPVVLLTAKAGDRHEIEGYKTGADSYVTKPYSSEKLKLIVFKLLEIRNKLKAHYSQTFSINPNLAITSTEADFLKRLQEVTEKNIVDPEFTSEKFSRLMSMSRSQLHKKLQAIVGLSASEFIRSQRLQLAKELLRKSDATISEIAYQVGFNTPSYFNKCFKQAYGCTPNEYLLKPL